MQTKKNKFDFALPFPQNTKLLREKVDDLEIELDLLL